MLCISFGFCDHPPRLFLSIRQCRWIFFFFFGTPVTKAYCRTMLLKLFVSVGVLPLDQSRWVHFKAHLWPPMGFKVPR